MERVEVSNISLLLRYLVLSDGLEPTPGMSRCVHVHMSARAKAMGASSPETDNKNRVLIRRVKRNGRHMLSSFRDNEHWLDTVWSKIIGAWLQRLALLLLLLLSLTMNW